MEDNTFFTDTFQTDSIEGGSNSPVSGSEFQDTPENTDSTESTPTISPGAENPETTPEQTAETPTPSPDDGVQEVKDYSQKLEDIQKLLTEIQNEQTDYYISSLELQTQITEEHKYFAEQSKNTLSVLVVIALILGFASGIVLARLVWRKI